MVILGDHLPLPSELPPVTNATVNDTAAETFESDRLVYRAIEGDTDDDFFYQLTQDFEAWQLFHFELPRPRSKERAADFRKGEARKLLAVIICLKSTAAEDPVPIGHLNVRWLSSDHHKQVNLGIIIHKDYRGQGYGSEALMWLVKWCFRTANLHRVEIACYERNYGARRLYTRLGFKEEGHHKEACWYQGRWWDHIIFRLLDHEWKEQEIQPEPTIVTNRRQTTISRSSIKPTSTSNIATFHSRRLMYRAVEPGTDDSFLREMAQDSVAWQQYTPSLPRPQTKQTAAEYSLTLRESLFGALICLPDAEATPIGVLKIDHIDKHTHHSHVNLSIFIHASFRGQGYGTEAIFWSLKWAFVTAGLHRVEIMAYGYNEGALRLYRNLGFKEEAVMREWIWYQGKWWDKIVFGILEKDWRALVGEKEVAEAKT